MAGLLARLLGALAEPGPDPSDSVDALAVAYQQQLATLHDLRTEANTLAASRRRLAVALAQTTDAAARTAAAGRDARLAAEQQALQTLSAALRDQLDAFRAERDLIAALPDPGQAARRTRDALARWQRETARLLRAAHAATESYPEPSGYVPDTGEPQQFEQPPPPGATARGLR